MMRTLWFAMALAAGQQADYQALIEKRTLGLLKVQTGDDVVPRLLAVNPRCYDAYLASGSEKYIIGSLIPPVRWLVGLTGVSGDKAEGIHELELTHNTDITWHARPNLIGDRIYS